MIDISFDKLFSVELLHKYSADGTCNDFTIVPSAATKQLLDNNQIIVKQNDNVLNAWIQLDPTALELNPQVKKPFIIPNEGLQLTFFMISTNYLFFNYTGIQRANNNGNIYCFSNRNINNTNNKNFLTGSLNDYHGGTFYSTEDIVINGGSVYQSLKNNNADALNNLNSWRQVMYPDPNNPGLNIPDPNRFMSSADLLKWMPSFTQLASTTATQVAVNDYAGNLIYTKTIQPSYPLDLSDLNDGKYLLTIGTDPQIPIYINNELSKTQVFGVIDIFIDSTLPGTYKILDSVNSTLLQPTYSIYFLNRATIWKYVLRSTNANATVTDSSNIFQFAQPIPKTSPTTILSQFSIPLSEAPITTLSLDGKSPPSATADRLNKNIQDLNDTHYYSEIFLNY